MILVGFLIILIGLGSLLESVLISLPLVVIGYVLAFARWGVEVDGFQKQIRSYITAFGMRFGKWESYSEFPFIAILRGRTAQTTYGGTANVSVTTRSNYYSITLLSQSHRDRFELDQYKTEEAAQALIDEVSQLMGLEKTIFSPEVSASTARRRRR